MNSAQRIVAALGIAVILAAAGAVRGQGTGSPTSGPAWQAPAPEAVRAQAMKWLDDHKADAAAKAKAKEIWSAPPEKPRPRETLNRMVQTFALADDNVRKLVDYCAKPRGTLMPPAQPWLVDPKADPFLAKNVRLWYVRWLVHEELYDEALEVLDGMRPKDAVASQATKPVAPQNDALDPVRPEDVVDPASLLFYEAVACHRLLNKDQGMDALGQLLDEPDQGPKRYVTIARLMEADLKDLKEDSLDHIARRMEDIQRRLDLGRGGKKVRKIEDGVVESLDKLIKEIEDQQQQSGAGAAGNNIRSSSPAQDSQPMGGKGKGDVDRKRVGSQKGWGNLPPKQREEALQQIGRDFPPHYREVIEQYFRKLASEGSE